MSWKELLKQKKEIVKYFKQLEFERERDAYRNEDEIAKEQAEVYGLVAFQIERNMK